MMNRTLLIICVVLVAFAVSIARADDVSLLTSLHPLSAIERKKYDEIKGDPEKVQVFVVSRKYIRLLAKLCPNEADFACAIKKFPPFPQGVNFDTVVDYTLDFNEQLRVYNSSLAVSLYTEEERKAFVPLKGNYPLETFLNECKESGARCDVVIMSESFDPDFHICEPQALEFGNMKKELLAQIYQRLEAHPEILKNDTFKEIGSIMSKLWPCPSSH